MQDHGNRLQRRMRWVAVLTLSVGLGVAGCHSNSDAANDFGQDPADVNAAQAPCANGQTLMSDGSCAAATQGNTSPAPAQPAAGSAPASATAPRQATAPAYPSQNASTQQSGESYPGQAPQASDQAYGAAPPDNSQQPYDNQPYDDQSYQDDAYNNGYQQGYDQGVDASQPPPPLPVYAQPPCPGDGYLWTPGYWGYGNANYYWVPGVWAQAPYTGALWTPGWWGFLGAAYRFHQGYWGPHVGFYGGVPYGYGYTGSGFHGGYWDRNQFRYNRSVTNVNITNIHNTYNRTVINNVTVNNRVSYNGGRGGLNARPTQGEFAAMREQHVRPLPAQVEHHQQAMQNRAQYANFNGGRPAALAVARPLQLQHVNVAPSMVNPGVRGETRPSAAMRPANLQRPNTQPAQPGQATPINGARPTIQPNHEPARPLAPTAARTQPARTPNAPGSAAQNPNGNRSAQPGNRLEANRPGNQPGANQSRTNQPGVNRPGVNQPGTNNGGTYHPSANNPARPAPTHTQPVSRPGVQQARPQPQQPRPQQPQQMRQQPSRPAPSTPQHVQPQPMQRSQPQARPESQPRPQPQSQPQHQEPPRQEAPHQEAPHQEAPHQEAPHAEHSPRP